MEDCIFCNINVDRIVDESEYCLAIRDGYPVTEHHTLIIPKQHRRTYFDLDDSEVVDIKRLIDSQRLQIERRDSSVKGFNIGMNCGSVAGQTVYHCHVHLIPRRTFDVKEPRGGVRNVIPGKGNYHE